MAKRKTTTNDKRPMVVGRRGHLRFMRGMTVATLIECGLSLKQADEASRLLRDRIADRKRITTAELRVEIKRLVKSEYGIDVPDNTADVAVVKMPMIRSAAGLFPFSSGVLARHLSATGLGAEDAVAISQEVTRRLSALPQSEIPEQRVEEAVYELLEASHPSAYSRRYRLIRWMSEGSVPVVILIGGATGTGKSTLATALAYHLAVRKVTGTDTIRETMRTVLSPAVVPGLHDHSFRGLLQGDHVLSEPRERVLAGFHQQAAQVAVGVRAVVRRAVRENTSIILEGTHLLPPFERLLPSRGTVLSAGVLMAISGRKLHRARFEKRAGTQPLRDPKTYLEAFQSVRWIHDDVLRLGEEHDAFVIDNRNIRKAVTNALDYLSHVLPIAGAVEPLPHPHPEAPDDEERVQTLFLIFDGLSDEPNPKLDGLTPLAAADIPTLRTVAGAGGQGRVVTGGKSLPTTTAYGLLSLLGGATPDKIGRGVLEAMGIGLPLHPDAIFFRGNFATMDDNGRVLDRRAGRIRDGAKDLLQGLALVELPGGVTGHIHHAHEHRVVVVLRGPGLSTEVTASDPGSAPIQRVAAITATSADPRAARTAEALRHLLVIARRELLEHPVNEERTKRGEPPANAIIVRGAGSTSDLASVVKRQVKSPVKSAVVASCCTALGVARALGMDTATDARMTGNLDTDIDAKFEVAAKLLEDHEFVVVHFKGTDIAAHECQPLEKRDFIARADAALARFLDKRSPDLGDVRIILSADHGTSSKTGGHISEPVPLLLGRWDETADQADFDEESSARGALGVLEPADLSALLWGEQSEADSD